ncbi:MAG: outer membrane protein assembly factor BamA [Candidatus Acidiferrales bacterium]
MAAARGRAYLQILIALVVSLLGFVIPSFGQQENIQPAQGQSSQGVITHIYFQGNRLRQRDALLAQLFEREGDPYNEDSAKRDFQALWNSQYFEDIRLEVEDDPKVPDGKILIFYVSERPIIRRIEYKGNKSVSESDILDRFKEAKVGLSVEGRFDPTRVKHAQVVIKDLLGEHGHQFARVDAKYERIAATNAVKLTFVIDEGPKVKVGRIIIQGNHVFSSRRIIRAMRHSRPVGVPLGPLGSFDLWSKTYDRRKLDEDLEVGIRGLYQDHGYFKVVVRDPILKTVDVNRSGIPGPLPIPVVGKVHGKQTNIVIPIEEGDRYRMGKITVRSLDPDQPLQFKQEFLERAFPLKQGDVFAADKIRKALEDYKKLYGTFGYIDFTAEPDLDFDDVHKIINVTLKLDQQKQFFVRRIDFTGNTTTRDKVIRREVLLDEGSVFNNRLWELSLLRLNQLDYFDPIKPENAEIKRNLKEGTVDINLKVKEKGKQSISLTGGVSGLAGSFVGFAYQTNNFLGLGETLTLSVNVGDRQRGILFGFTEPYLLDRPISTGFTVFDNRFDFNQARETSLLVGQNVAINPALAQNYAQNQKGFTVFASYPLRKFSFARLGVTYAYTDSSINAFSPASQLLFNTLQFDSLGGPSQLSGIKSSKIQPTISYSTINSPVNPTSGKSFFYGLGIEGGPLGGAVKTLSNTFSMEYFHPVNKNRNAVGFRVQTAVESGYGGLALPPYERFFLGGENDVRGFDFFTISPFTFIPEQNNQQLFYLDPTKLDAGGRPTVQAITVPVLQFAAVRPGGDFQTVANVEYRIPIAGPVSMSLFGDMGIDSILFPSQLQLSSSGFSQLEKNFPNVKLSQHLQVVPGTNFHPRSSVGIEFVVNIPVVHAPFRVYYAYNAMRLSSVITQPRGAFFLTPAQQEALPPNVFKALIAPQLNTILDEQQIRIPNSLFEPRNTFRFTVSRTF